MRLSNIIEHSIQIIRYYCLLLAQLLFNDFDEVPLKVSESCDISKLLLWTNKHNQHELPTLRIKFQLRFASQRFDFPIDDKLDINNNRNNWIWKYHLCFLNVGSLLLFPIKQQLSVNNKIRLSSLSQMANNCLASV